MIGCDTSSLIAFFEGKAGRDIELLERSIKDSQLFLPPPVLSEMLSSPNLPLEIEQTIGDLPLLEITDGYWSRVGKLRSEIIAKGKKARLADALIAQICIDHDSVLISRDRDYSHFKKLKVT